MPFQSELKPIQLYARARAIIRMKDNDQLTFKDIGKIFHISDTLAHRLYEANKPKKVEEGNKQNGPQS